MVVILPPNRFGEMVEAMMRGDQVDARKYAVLQANDMVELGREFVRSAIEREDAADEQIRRLLDGNAGDGG